MKAAIAASNKYIIRRVIKVKLKKTIAMIMTIVLLCLSCNIAVFAASANTAVGLYINNKKAVVTAYSVDGTAFVPFRETFETMNCKTEWNTATNALKAVKGKMVIEVTLGSLQAKAGDKVITLKVAPRLINGKTYVPLSLVSDSLGHKAAFDAKKKRVDITGSGIGTPGGVIHSGYIKPEGETWTAENGPHIIQYSFEVGGPTAPVLVIEPGALVLFDSGAELKVGWVGPGGLMVNGTPEAPVRFEANTDSVQPGYYYGIVFYESSIQGKTYIRNASIQSAGSSGSFDGGAITLWNHSKPTTGVELTNVEIKNCMRYGLKLFQDCKLAPNSSNVSVIGTAPFEGKNGYAISADMQSSNALPVGGAFMNNFRNAIQITGTDTISENLLWKNLGIPYAPEWSIEVGGQNNPVFTIEPGVVALFNPGQWIQVGWSGKGSIVADANAAVNGINRQVLEAAQQLASPDAMLDKSLELLKHNKTIVFGTLGDPLQKGSWYGIRLLEGSAGGNIFNGCVISGAGIPGGYGGRGALSAIADAESTFKVANTLITGSASSGLDLIGKVGLVPDSIGNVLKNNEFPIRVSPFAAGSLLPGNEILDNVNNYIQVLNGSASTLQTDLLKSATWSSLGVPYLIQDPFNVDGSLQEAVLTLKEGVTMVFGSGSGIDIGEKGPGALLALGTAAKPVTFTSLLKQPGGWNGLHFFEMSGPLSKMDNIVLEYAQTGITFEVMPGSDILTNSTVQLCKNFGIDQKYVDIIKKVLNFAMPNLGNVFNGNGQDTNKQ